MIYINVDDRVISHILHLHVCFDREIQ